ncbi:MAG: RluA family pseudouridine synthase [Verrucomicrobia bacterium]|nr:RluA family pseudouridine synthase [Verrucomicrobiota bacterium]
MKKGENKLRWRVSKKQAGMRLLQFLRESYPEAPSVKAIKRAIDGKLCTVNNRTETFSSYTLEENDIVVLKEDTFEIKKELKVSRATVLYEDKELLIINKPAGIVSDAKSIKSSLPDAKGTLELVHRLDKETSGVLILAKTPEAKEKMVSLFKERTVRKLYLALVDGVVAKDEGTIDNFLGRKHSYQGQTVYGTVEENKGQRAITYWKCLKRGKVASVVCCEPYTGRTHQLRVHLSTMGHPILGDSQYGKKFICHLKPCRNLLHAYSITFKHPTNGKAIKAIAPIPADFKQALDELKISLK